jgi:MoaA/NifB/PqqE/SkfB family radical SAM enzyme
MKILFLRVGLACNNRCSMCAGTWTSQAKLSTNEMIQKLEIGSQYGFDEVVISGGEPTVRQDIPAIANAARRLGYQSIVLQTNARRLSNMNFSSQLIKAGITRFLVSVHGATSVQHDNQTRIQGSFDQAITGIRNINNLSDGAARIAVHSVILPSNYKSLSEIVDLVFSLGIPMLKLSYVVPVGRASGIFNHQTCPTMTEILPYLFSAIDHFISLYRNTLMTSISIGYIPLCLLSGYEDFSDEKSVPTTYFMNDNYELELADEKIVARDLKIKGKNCVACKHNQICGGLWREYPEYFGWGEFKPVV